MVIDDFHIKGILVAPHEANTPLIIDTYTVLSRSIALQLLKPIRRRNPQRIELRSRRKHLKLSCRYAMDVSRKATGKPALEYPLRLSGLEGLDHLTILSGLVSIVKR